VQAGFTGAASQASLQTGQACFGEILQHKITGLKFSAHAAARMSSRGMTVTPELVDKLDKAASGLAGKGARDSLIMMKNCAFIVNIPNRTVVTAMDGQNLKENIFTNIDSAVIAE